MVAVVLALVLVAVGVAVLVQRGSSPPPVAAPPVASPPPTSAGITCPPGGTEVQDATELQQALDDAAPGDVISLADGRYPGEFVASAAGTAEDPIVLCGGRDAVLDGGAEDAGYTLHLDGASYWQVLGFTVRGGQKGVMADRATGNLLAGLAVQDIGDEAVHLRQNSSDNRVEDNVIRNTGLRKPQFGEGIYIGSAESNWCDQTDCEPDRSDRNVITGNDVAGTTAESVDIKEGTTDGVLADNVFSGAAMVESDSWVDVKGNGWTITGNQGSDAPEDGMQTHEILDGWGMDNVFADNILAVNGPGYGINVTKREGEGNRVACSNEVSGAGEGLSTIDCTDPR